MANSYNKIILVGRIGRDAELRATPKGTQVAETSLAVDDLAKKKPEGGFETEWYRIKVWGRQAETLAPMLLKGNARSGRGPALDPERTRTRDKRERYSPGGVGRPRRPARQPGRPATPGPAASRTRSTNSTRRPPTSTRTIFRSDEEQ